MTTNEILMLCTGIAFGGQLMNALHAYWDSKDARRAADAARDAMKRTAADRYLTSLRLYRLQQRTGVQR